MTGPHSASALGISSSAALRRIVRPLAVMAAMWASACGGDGGTGPEPPPPNRPPVATGSLPAQTMTAGESAQVEVAPFFSDPDDDPLTYAAASSNAAVVGVSAAGSTVTVMALAAGTATLTVTAHDPEGLEATQTSSVTVEPANRAPVAAGTIPAQTMTAGESAQVEVAPFFRDPDNDPLTYAAASSNAAVVGVSAAGSTVTVMALAAGTATLTVTARDPEGLEATQTSSITVEPANRPPVAAGSIPPRTMTAGETATVDVAPFFRDPDNDALTYASSSSNTGIVTASVSGSTVTVTGVAEGIATVTVTASDPGGLTASVSMNVTVTVGDGTEYTPLSGLTITQSGGVRFAFFNTSACITVGTIVINNTEYIIHWTEWQRSTGSGWSQLPGTRRNGAICGYDLTTAPAGEYRLAGELSIDGVRGRYRSSNTVTVGGGSGVGFRDDFDSSASLDDWEIFNADAAIANGVLRITSNRAGFVGGAERELERPLNTWMLRVSMGRAQRDGLAGVWWTTGLQRYPIMAFNVGPIAETNFSTWVRDADEDEWIRFTDLSGSSMTINDGLNELTEITLGWDGEEVFISSRDTDLVRRRPNETLATLLAQIRSVALVMEGDVGRIALFDHVQVTGTRSSADASSRAETADWIQSLRVPKGDAVAGTAAGGLDITRTSRSGTRNPR